MSRPNRKIISGIVTLGLLVGGVAYLFASSAGEAFEYYKHVDEITAAPAQWQHKHVQMHGFVVPGSIMRKPDSLDWRFKVQNKGHVVTASYTGIVPDTFKDEAEVVLKGGLTQDGGFHVQEDGVMAKCPSKYSPKAGAGGATAGTN